MAKALHRSKYAASPSNRGRRAPDEEETTFRKRDYSALSSALLKKGEFRLLQGDLSALKLFEMAAKLDPSNSELFYAQGLALFEYGSEEGKENELRLASKKFKRATQLDQSFFEAWQVWGNTLYLLGMRTGEIEFFYSAKQKYEKALFLSKTAPEDLLPDLYWDLGTLFTKLADISGEADDLRFAVKFFQQAVSSQQDLSAEFWLHYGNASYKLGIQVNDVRHLLQAINYYKNSISLAISSATSWLYLAKALSTLYSYTHDEDHFSQANECYTTVSQLEATHKELWIEWGALLLESGTHFNEIKKLAACIEKCRRGSELSPKDPKILSIWAQALSFIGVMGERLDLLYEANNKLEEIDKEMRSDLNLIYAQGICLINFASYFKDPEYLYQAVEKFQEGLSINRASCKLWYGIAIASRKCGEFDSDEKCYQQACRFFEKALDLRSSSTIHYEYALCLSEYGEASQNQELLEQAIFHFERALQGQKNTFYIHPQWLFKYAYTLDLLAHFQEEEAPYIKGIEILSQLLMMEPDFPKIHYHLALIFAHYGELIENVDIFHRALHHFRIAHQQDKESDQILLDWGVTLLHVGELLENTAEGDHYFREGEYKLIQAAKLGNPHAYYFLAAFYCFIGQINRSLDFLYKALAFQGLPPLEEILEEEWLDGLKEKEEFVTFLSKIESKME